MTGRASTSDLRYIWAGNMCHVLRPGPTHLLLSLRERGGEREREGEGERERREREREREREEREEREPSQAPGLRVLPSGKGCGQAVRVIIPPLPEEVSV